MTLGTLINCSFGTLLLLPHLLRNLVYVPLKHKQFDIFRPGKATTTIDGRCKRRALKFPVDLRPDPLILANSTVNHLFRDGMSLNWIIKWLLLKWIYKSEHGFTQRVEWAGGRFLFKNWIAVVAGCLFDQLFESNEMIIIGNLSGWMADWPMLMMIPADDDDGDVVLLIVRRHVIPGQISGGGGWWAKEEEEVSFARNMSRETHSMRRRGRKRQTPQSDWLLI